MNKIIRYFIISILIVSLPLAALGCSSSSSKQSQSEPEKKADETITLQAISFLPKNHPLVQVLPMWIKRVEESTGGQVRINWKGGPESIPSLEQIEAIRNGLIDVNFNVTAYYESLAPEIRAFSLSEYTPWEERENGFYNYMAERHKNNGVIYLGRWLSESISFYFWVNKPANSPDDLKGRTMRTQAMYDRYMRQLGIAPVPVEQSETYTALERGVVEGFGWPILGPRENGWTEKTKYVIDHILWNQNATILINPKAWEKLTPDLQQKVIQASADFEHDMVNYFNDISSKERTKLQEHGVKFIKFSPEDAKQYVKGAYDVEWKFLQTKVPDQIPELQKFCRK